MAMDFARRAQGWNLDLDWTPAEESAGHRLPMSLRGPAALPKADAPAWAQPLVLVKPAVLTEVERAEQALEAANAAVAAAEKAQAEAHAALVQAHIRDARREFAEEEAAAERLAAREQFDRDRKAADAEQHSWRLPEADWMPVPVILSPPKPRRRRMFSGLFRAWAFARLSSDVAISRRVVLR